MTRLKQEISDLQAVESSEMNEYNRLFINSPSANQFLSYYAPNGQ